MSKKRFIVNKGLSQSLTYETIEDLEKYLNENPYSDYRLVSVLGVDYFILIWELKESRLTQEFKKPASFTEEGFLNDDLKTNDEDIARPLRIMF